MSKILDAATASATPSFRFGGGKGRVSVYGTFGTGNVTLKYRAAGSADSFRAVSSSGASPSFTNITAAFENNFELPECDLQVDYTAGGGSSLTVEIFRFADA